MKKKTIIGVGALLVALGATGALALVERQQSQSPTITVYKTENCGCCNKWVDHLEEAGFVVTAENVTDLNAIKQDVGVTADLASCHTGIVEGYVIEGHVPAADIKRLLEERPDGKGLAVPGMPMGSPGMEGDYADAYDVLLFDGHGGTTTFASY